VWRVLRSVWALFTLYFVGDLGIVYGMKTKFTKAEIRQLLAYASERESSGWYYGKKDDFNNRHAKIVDKLEQMLADNATGSSGRE
jgi:hypothetical protein